MAGTPKMVAAVAGLAALAGIGVGPVPDQEQPSSSSRMSSMSATTTASQSPPAAPLASPTSDIGDPGTGSGQPGDAAPAPPQQVPAGVQPAVVQRIIDGDPLEIAAAAAYVTLVHMGLLTLVGGEADGFTAVYGDEGILAPPASVGESLDVGYRFKTVEVERARPIGDAGFAVLACHGCALFGAYCGGVTRSPVVDQWRA